MPIWKPHSLAKPEHDTLQLRTGDRVEAIVTLDSNTGQPVPEGTQGVVMLANGFNWLRFRVLFDNGVELGDLDDRHLRPAGRAAKRATKRAKAAARGA